MNDLYKQKDAEPADPIGGKAGALAALRDAGFRIPAWFALSPAAFQSAGNGNGKTSATENETANGNRHAAKLSPPALESLTAALREICPENGAVAVRSSAMEEDGAEHSFAGQLRSFLTVPLDEVPARAADVWQSAFSEPVLRYRKERGLQGDPHPPAVLVQRMVYAETAGVAFGADPVSGRRDHVLISAALGLGEKLVSGEVEGQTWRIDATDTVTREFPETETSILTDAQAREIAALARRTGEHFDCPQDIEWAIAGGELFLLQSRPITSLGDENEDDGALAIWDNSNIVESYRGITGPLTFSFARSAYEGVYRQFCRILRVPSAAVDANDATFKGMIGSINGRIYYNLLNWYRVLAMLPGYKLNRKFMEQMMGVKEGLPDAVADEIASGNTSGRFADGLRALGSFGGLIINLVRLKATIRRFYTRLEDALRIDGTPLEEMTPRELAAHYRELERRLLTRWDAPLLNDFFCMIFYGVLKGLGAKWCGSAHLHDELLQGSGRMISAEPATRLRELAALARRDPEFAQSLASDSLETIQENLERFPAFRTAFEDYLEKFGERCSEELKLETPTLHDDPLPVLRAAGNLAIAAPRSPEPVPGDASGALPGENENHEQALAGHPLRKTLFRWVLRQTRERVRERENLRFERTRVFGRVRRIFVEIGKRLHDGGRLRDWRDVFYLEIETVLESAARIEGETEDLQSSADAARAAEARFREMPPPPNRFETRGPVTEFIATASPSPITASGAEPDESERRGLGCSPGVTRGSVRVVRDPRNAGLVSGEILVAESTDPGWILLFPLAAGIVVERGSPLSHSAIVARELGIPAVVSLENAAAWLRNGDEVEIDGAAGTVRLLSRDHCLD